MKLEPDQVIAHRCRRGRYRPYPKLLCSCCHPDDRSLDFVTTRVDVEKLNAHIPAEKV